MDKSEQERLREEGRELWFGVRRSVRYHDRRVSWFDRLHRFGRFVTLVAGGGAVATILKDHTKCAISMSLICAIASALDLAFDVSVKARLHNSLKRKFIELESSISLIGHENLTDNQLREFTTQRLRIESDEPPVMRVLDTLCHNELCRADGYSERIPVKWWQRILAHVWTGEPPEKQPAKS